MNLATEPMASRRDAFAVSADRRGLLPALIEKDFWVCWTLERLFGLPDFGPHLLFKGGTSLSKVYGAIQRFSEDIDLSLSRHFVEGILPDPMGATSNTQRKQRTALLVAAFHQAVTDRLLPALRADITANLGEEGSGAAGWTLSQDARNPGTLHFAYPRAVPEVLPYVRPEVKIELGGRSDDWPAEEKTVTAYVAQDIPAVTPQAVPVRALAARRTFWEKATLLHAECHRPPDGPTGERLSRHYSDLAQMAVTEIGAEALADLPLLDRVRRHKIAFYTSPWANYETARPGTLRLVPPPARVDALRADYRGMAPMFFGPSLSFEAMMPEIAALEARVNALADTDPPAG